MTALNIMCPTLALLICQPFPDVLLADWATFIHSFIQTCAGAAGGAPHGPGRPGGDATAR